MPYKRAAPSALRAHSLSTTWPRFADSTAVVDGQQARQPGDAGCEVGPDLRDAAVSLSVACRPGLLVEGSWEGMYYIKLHIARRRPTGEIVNPRAEPFLSAVLSCQKNQM